MATRPTSGPGGVAHPRPHPQAPYHPPGDTATYRDLLLFEERLKSNAEMLRRRRQRYNIFLWSFLCALFTMGYRLWMQPPTNMIKLRALQAGVAVTLITLALFFASGMYEEKIRYAHSYINHSNKALRPLNMHLNMRRPRPAFFSYIPFVQSSGVKASAPSAPPVAPLPQPLNTSGKPFLGGKGGVTATARKASGSSNVMATIPPSTNPRGELIFSSRVDRMFREGYERYRAAFERRREEKAREEARRTAKGWFWTGQALARGASPSPAGSRSTPTATPPLSRRDTPSPGPPDSTSGRYPPHEPSPLAGGDSHRRSPSPGSSSLRHAIGTMPLRDKDGPEKERQDGKRERAESYSFVLNGQQTKSRGIGVPPRKGS
ncbi:hypothetical protein IAU60_005453 [Kwoniella sp. DSM 27419]